MLSYKVKKYLYNPSLGLIPLLVYLGLHTFLGESTSLLISISVAIVSEVCMQHFFRSRLFTIPFMISILSLLLTFFIWFFTAKFFLHTYIYSVIFEIFIIIFILLALVNKVSINVHILLKKDTIQKTFVSDFFSSARYVQYLLIAHLLIVLLYNMLEINGFDFLVYSIIPSVLIFMHIFYEVMKQILLNARLRKEEWLPIVTERGEVTGKIAKSVSFKMKGKFLHPVVRIALVHNDKIYLQTRDQNDILSPSKLDYPFEKYMLFEHEINISVRNCLYKIIGKDLHTHPTFLLKYLYEGESSKRLIFLFVLKVKDENVIKRTSKMTGKFWTAKQIEESFKDELFGECFELEYEYIKNTVLTPHNNAIVNLEHDHSSYAAIPDTN